MVTMDDYDDCVTWEGAGVCCVFFLCACRHHNNQMSRLHRWWRRQCKWPMLSAAEGGPFLLFWTHMKNINQNHLTLLTASAEQEKKILSLVYSLYLRNLIFHSNSFGHIGFYLQFYLFALSSGGRLLLLLLPVVICVPFASWCLWSQESFMELLLQWREFFA